MKTKVGQSGISLTETTVVVAAVALLASLSTPTIRTFFDSLASRDSTRAMISASLSTARAIAAREQKYAGIRFQNDLTGNQYMIFIVHDPTLVDSSTYPVTYSGFRAVEGIKPIKLPVGVGVTDLRLGATVQYINADDLIDESFELADAATFSVVFAPSGKLVVHTVQVLRKNAYDTVFNQIPFNSYSNVQPTFEDDFQILSPAFRQEFSRNSFVIYDKSEFAGVNAGSRWTGYLERLVPETVYINAYTGRIISSDQ